MMLRPTKREIAAKLQGDTPTVDSGEVARLLDIIRRARARTYPNVTGMSGVRDVLDEVDQ